MIRNIYCLDTNVLVESADAIFAFDKHEIVIPFTVLIELDEQKKRSDSVGQNARRTIRILDSLRETGSLVVGVKINEGKGLLRISKVVPDDRLRDDAIIRTAEELTESYPDRKVVLITNDLNMRIKADVIGICAESFEWEGQPKIHDDIYSGASQIKVQKNWIDNFYQNKKNSIPTNAGELFSNQFLIMKNNNTSAIGRLRGDSAHMLSVNERSEIWGLKPRNKEQQFALDLLLDPEVSLVSLIGRAGSGKTLLAVAAGMQQVVEKKVYSKMLVSRPIQAMGNDIGFLPGTMEEKLAPWVQPIKDNLLFLLKGNKQTMELMFSQGTVEIEALTYIRGRSISRSYIIVDECQNLSAMELKAIITRAGEGSKIVLTGDIEQIDNPYFDPMSNGLTYIVEKFKDKDVAGHIKLIKGERSPLATLAAKIL